MHSASDLSLKKAELSKTASTDDLKAELETLRDDLKSLIGTTQTVLKAQSQSGVERGQDVLDEAAKNAVEVRDLAQDAVRKNPLTSIGLALGVGALLATLRSK